jgi:hypothetical protein
MSETPVSLLERLRSRPDDASWRRLVDLYTPLILSWLRRHFAGYLDGQVGSDVRVVGSENRKATSPFLRAHCVHLQCDLFS